MTTDAAYYNAEAADKADESVSFSFGRNWKKFLSRFDEQTLARAQQSFVQFNHIDRLDNYDFLDIGSGSGLSSLVAVQLGARRVVSVDIDPFSIECTQKLRERFEVPEENWEVRSGSALDPEFMESLGRFRYVHSWGVLHHTGAMWEALANVVRYNVDAHGLLHLALYNKHRTSKRWLAIKRFCNRSPRIGYPLVKWAYIAALFSKLAARGVWPMAHVREYRRDRGMDFYRDIEDWLLGLPYEFASPDEMVDYFSDRELHLLRLRTTPSCGCNEFLFCKPA